MALNKKVKNKEYNEGYMELMFSFRRYKPKLKLRGEGPLAKRQSCILNI